MLQVSSQQIALDFGRGELLFGFIKDLTLRLYRVKIRKLVFIKALKGRVPQR